MEIKWGFKSVNGVQFWDKVLFYFCGPTAKSLGAKSMGEKLTPVVHMLQEFSHSTTWLALGQGNLPYLWLSDSQSHVHFASQNQVEVWSSMFMIMKYILASRVKEWGCFLQNSSITLTSKLLNGCHVGILQPWTVACQAPLSMGISRQEYWSGLPFPSLGDLPDSGIEPGSPALQADSLPTELQGKPPCILPDENNQLQKIGSVQFSGSVMSNSLWPHESQHARPPCPSPTPWVHSN